MGHAPMIKILIMGLPGSGKTTLASNLSTLLSPNCLWLNADTIREQYNDWDFSYEGRLRQSKRMHDLAAESDTQYVVCDFVAPIKEMRDIFNPDITIWMDTIAEGRFADTNKLFEDPTGDLLRITTMDSEYWSKYIVKNLLAK